MPHQPMDFGSLLSPGLDHNIHTCTPLRDHVHHSLHLTMIGITQQGTSSLFKFSFLFQQASSLSDDSTYLLSNFGSPGRPANYIEIKLTKREAVDGLLLVC